MHSIPFGGINQLHIHGNYILQNARNARNVQNNNCPLLRCGGKTPETNKCFINERYTSYIYLIGFIDFAYNLV